MPTPFLTKYKRFSLFLLISFLIPLQFQKKGYCLLL
nr:MAG TPA: hypothetical protein [Caudoviricetes sp.]